MQYHIFSPFQEVISKVKFSVEYSYSYESDSIYSGIKELAASASFDGFTSFIQ